MKDIWKIGLVLLGIICLAYIIFLKECVRPDCTLLAEDEMIIQKSVWDSILSIADKPPVVIIDTVTVISEVVKVVETEIPIPVVDDTLRHYRDSLVNDEINLWVDYAMTGQLISRTWSYKPIIRYITRDSVILVPHPIEVEKVVRVPSGGLYGHLSGGYITDPGCLGSNTGVGLGMDYISAGGVSIGYTYHRIGYNNYHTARIGFRIFGNR